MKNTPFNILLKLIIIICSLAGITFLALAYCYFRFDYLFISILCAGLAIYYKVSDFSKYGIWDLFKNALARLIACYFVFAVVSMFCNLSINCNKPAYTYKYYHKNKPLITEVFPDSIPESANNVHFYMVEQGFMQGSPFVRLSFYADAETIEGYTNTYPNSCLASGHANSTYSYNDRTYNGLSLTPYLPEEMKGKEADFYIYYMEVPDDYSEHISIVAVNKNENFVLFYED